MLLEDSDGQHAMNNGTDQRFTRASSRINMNAQSTRKARNYDFVMTGNMAEQPVMKHLPQRIADP